ncbi:MAG TPA: hypothetical protein VFB60_11835 [Ktedonobacteraceae bacterium]|nr:hypothetical protein [Ktedonobacteraceae bacterium]
MAQDHWYPHDQDDDAHTEENGVCCGAPTCYCALGASATQGETSC